MDKTTVEPDSLLENIGRSVMFKALVWSVIGHLIFTGLTSISLWKDWASDWNRFGLRAPGTINAIKGEDRKAAEEAKRKAEAAAKAEAEAKAAEEAKAKDEAKAKGQGEGRAVTGEGGDKKKPPEVQPLPPKKEFELGDDLQLD